MIIEFSKTLEMFDLNQSEARLFAFMYLSNKPLTLDDMSEALGKSKTSMSTSARSLTELKLISPVWKKGVRKDLYQANPQLFKIFMMTYIDKWVDASKSQKEGLEKIKRQIHEQEALPNMEDRLEEVIEFHRQIEQFFACMKQEHSSLK